MFGLRLVVAAVALANALNSITVNAQSKFTPLGPNAQPGGFHTVQENSQASAMMLALIDQTNVMIIDKAENNEDRLPSGRPVWGTVMDLDNDYSVRGLEMSTNPFCAGGAQLGNGTWIVAGGNHAIGYGGGDLKEVQPANGPYKDLDGGQAIRVMNPAGQSSDLEWIDEQMAMSSVRWYPGVEVMKDGSVLLIGGAIGGGYINRNYPNVDPATQGGGANPTWEFYPSKGNTPTNMNFMVNTSGLNMYPHTYLMPSGKVFMQANYSTVLWQPYENNEATAYDILDDMPDRIVRVYPASGATAMLPLTPANNYTPTILFCGGSVIDDAGWGSYGGPKTNLYTTPAQTDCSSITPEDADGKLVSTKYTHEENLPEPRSMGQFIHLPTGQMVVVNGASYGTAGYTNATWNNVNNVNLEGCAQQPTYTPVLYDPEQPLGKRLSRKGFGSSPIARLYHSSAILVPDGSVLIAGSNPHQDVSLNMPPNSTPEAFNTTYAVEKWYPPYYFENRPEPQGLPEYILYGGDTWKFTMDAAFMGSSANYKANATKVMVIRPGFSTHAMNMGQRSLQLQHAYTVNSDGSVSYTVNPMPTNQNIFVQGPALLFVTIDGVPSMGKYIQIGLNGIGNSPIPNEFDSLAAPPALPANVDNPNFTAIPASAKDGDDSHLGAIIGGAVGAGVALLALIALIVFLVRRKRRQNAYAVPAGNRNKTNDDIYGVSGYSAVALRDVDRQRMGSSQHGAGPGGMYAGSSYSMGADSMMSKPNTPYVEHNASSMYSVPMMNDGSNGRHSQSPSYNGQQPNFAVHHQQYGTTSPSPSHGSVYQQQAQHNGNAGTPRSASAYQPYSSGDQWRS